MFNKLKYFVLILLWSVNTHAQIYDPVTWDFSYEKKDTNRYEIIFIASIEKNSHIYSMEIPENGPIPTSFNFDTIPGFVLDGKPFEVTKPEEIFDYKLTHESHTR